jgi:hypothetical protein
MQAPQPGLQGRRARGPDQPVTIVERAQEAIHLARPALRGIRAVLGGTEGVVGDEHLRPPGFEGPPDFVGGRALMCLPARRHLGQRDHPGGRRLAHLGRPGEDGEMVLVQHGQGAGMGSRRHEHARERRGRVAIERRRGARLVADQLVERSQPEHRRHRLAQLRTGIDPRRQLTCPEHSDPQPEVPGRLVKRLLQLPVAQQEVGARDAEILGMLAGQALDGCRHPNPCSGPDPGAMHEHRPRQLVGQEGCSQ